MFCQNCGKEINETDTFCGFCGSKVVLVEKKSKDEHKLEEENITYDNISQNNVKDSMKNQENYNANINQDIGCYNQNNNMYDQNNNNMYQQNNNYNNQYVDGQVSNYVSQHRQFSETVFGKLVSNYFKKPLSIFSLMKEEDTLKTSIGLLIGMPILYGFFHMLYFISFFKKLINNLAYYISNILNDLSTGLGNILGLKYTASDFFDISDGIAKVKEKVQTYVSLNMKCSDYFFKGILVMFLLILITFVVIEICNTVILKNSISQKNVIFIVTVGFVPLIMALILNNVVIYISFIATLCIFAFGLIMSLITIFSGIIQLNSESRDRVYLTMCINNIVLFIAMPFIIKIGVNSVCETVVNIIQVICKSL